MLIGLEKKVSIQHPSSFINWVSPIPGYVKLNCDGAIRSLGEAAACGVFSEVIMEFSFVVLL